MNVKDILSVKLWTALCAINCDFFFRCVSERVNNIGARVDNSLRAEHSYNFLVSCIHNPSIVCMLNSHVYVVERLREDVFNNSLDRAMSNCKLPKFLCFLAFFELLSLSPFSSWGVNDFSRWEWFHLSLAMLRFCWFLILIYANEREWKEVLRENWREEENIF